MSTLIKQQGAGPQMAATSRQSSFDAIFTEVLSHSRVSCSNDIQINLYVKNRFKNNLEFYIQFDNALIFPWK